jgi:site-specific recombinase XerD
LSSHKRHQEGIVVGNVQRLEIEGTVLKVELPMMIKTLFMLDHVRARHWNAPLLNEREQYLSHLLRQGTSVQYLRCIAADLLNVVCMLKLTSARSIELTEIHRAAERWQQDEQGHRRGGQASGKAAYRFAIAAQNWLRFHGWLVETPIPILPFDSFLAEFLDNLRFTRGLSKETIRNYSERAGNFLTWLGSRRSSFSEITLSDVDAFIAGKQAAGWQLRTIASQCQALRTFFKYAEAQGWCIRSFARGIRSPAIPKYDEAPKGPTWKNVRRLLQSADGKEPAELRARAVLSLFCIYGLRSSEVAQLTLDDFDWRNEIITVRRAKRGRLQQYPIQYEVGEAILRYLLGSRPRCACRNLFVTRYPPHRPVHSTVLWPIVSLRIKRLGIQSQHMGPHSLRHACATQLLKRGTPLRDIADFLGHRDLKSVCIYAKYDTRTLRQVAAFSLAGIR